MPTNLISRIEGLLEKASKRPWSLHAIEKYSHWKRFTVVSPDGIVANIDEGQVAQMEANAQLIEEVGNAAPAIMKVVKAAQDVTNTGPGGWQVAAIQALRAALAQLEERDAT